jgi:hypothetical protein
VYDERVLECLTSRRRITRVQSFRWLAAFVITESFTFFCLVIAKLLVLDRMKSFAVHRAIGAPRWWVVGSRVLVSAAVGLGVVGACGSVGASIYSARAAGFYSAAADAAAANSTGAETQLNQGANQAQNAARFTAVQIACELVVLLLIVIAFSFVGAASFRRLRYVMNSIRNSDNDGPASKQVQHNGQELQRQLVGTVAVVFVSFLMRVVFSIMFAIANALQNSGDACPSYSGRCDPICYNVFSRMQVWLLYTPEFEILIVLISQPVALIIALWGMTSGRMLELMKATRVSLQNSS